MSKIKTLYKKVSPVGFGLVLAYLVYANLPTIKAKLGMK